MRVQRINLEADYDMLKTWWTRRGGSPPPLNMLPDIGVMVMEDKMPLACAFLYTISNASIAIAEWEATNPDCQSAVKKLKALHMAFHFFEEWVKTHEIGCLLSWVVAGRGDGRLLSQRGWIKPQGQPHEMMAYVPAREAVCL